MNANQPTSPQAEASFASADDKMSQEDVSENDLCLPTGWKTTLPELDQVWISESLFRWSESSLPELDPTKTDNHWHYPPSPSLSPQNGNGVPKLQQYYGHPLFLWMPHSQLNANLLCPQCKNTKLTYEGLHQELKQVFGYENFYFLASESLSCASCNQSVVAWSNSIISQLYFGVRLAFPCLLTGTLGCDNRVVRLMRAKGLDNLKWVENLLKKQYEQEWANKKLQFMNVVQSSSKAGVDDQIPPALSEELPAMLPFPNYDWLLQVYVQDTVCRMDEIKASITSLFGQVLTIDSSINMVLNFSGQEQPKTVWVTNVWNEHGQIITNVLTEAKGSDLTMMAAGLVQRYKQAGVKPPKALYVDSDCCGASRIKTIFQEWPEMEIRLDVGHFKKGFAPGCINPSGLSYTYFMSELSQCILEWDEKDLKRLREATLEEDGSTPTESELTWHVKKEDMKRHCKKFVRNTQDMEQRIERVIEVCKGKLVHNLYGAPLFNSELIDKVWEEQRRHLPCLQNPPGLTLYTKTKTEKKGGRMLPVYQCARGKGFMKRFSQHIKKFHADKRKSPSVFQALLLDGLSRWNATRAGKSAQSPFSVRSSALAHSVNQLAQLVWGEKVTDNAAQQECSGDFNSSDDDMEMANQPSATSVQMPDCPREEQPQEEKPLLECENPALDFPDSNNTSTENAKCTEDAPLFLTVVKVEDETLLSPCKEEDMESPIQPPNDIDMTPIKSEELKLETSPLGENVKEEPFLPRMESPIQPPNNIDMTPIKSEEIKVETLSDDVKEEPFLPPCSDEVPPGSVTPEQTQVAHTVIAPPAGHFLPQQLATPSSLFITAGLPITSQRLLLAPVQLTAPPPPAPQKLTPILSAPAPQPLVRYVVNSAPGVLVLQPTPVSAPLLANAPTIQHAETRGKSHRRILSKKLE